MKRVRITRNYTANVDALAPILSGGAMESVVEAAGDRVAARAREIAPVVTGAYRDAIASTIDHHPGRVVAHVGSRTTHAILVELRTSTMRRALG